MPGRSITRGSVIGLNAYSTDAKLIGKVTDLEIDLADPTNTKVVIDTGKDLVKVPVSGIKAVGDIVLIDSEALENAVRVEKSSTATTGAAEPQPAAQPAQTSAPATPTTATAAAAPTTPVSQPVTQPAPSTQYVIPRCPNCGSALIYYPKYRAWYCPKCRKYVTVSPDILSRVPRCPYCGNYLSYIEQYGKWYCYNCNRYVEV